MNYRNAELIADLTPRSAQNFHGLDSLALMNKLLSIGYQTMTLNGAFLDYFHEQMFLFVEEDVQFLMSAYLHLEKLIKTSENFQHCAYLNDGRFSLNATSDRKMVEIKFEFCPDLNVANLVTYNISESEENYIYWWRSIAHEILKIVSG
jgi:hypothetical protein